LVPTISWNLTSRSIKRLIAAPVFIGRCAVLIWREGAQIGSSGRARAKGATHVFTGTQDGTRSLYRASDVLITWRSISEMQLCKYKYTAMDCKGRECSGRLEASSPEEAVSKIKDKGLFPTNVSEICKVPSDLSDKPMEKWIVSSVNDDKKRLDIRLGKSFRIRIEWWRQS
jgi:hypothetical protein